MYFSIFYDIIYIKRMTKKFDAIKDINGNQETLELVARIVELWVVVNHDTSKYMEMILMDDKVDYIFYFHIFVYIYLFLQLILE